MDSRCENDEDETAGAGGVPTSREFGSSSPLPPPPPPWGDFVDAGGALDAAPEDGLPINITTFSAKRPPPAAMDGGRKGSQQARQEKRISALRAKALRDPKIVRVQDALEHAIVTGAFVRRDNWRQREFWRRVRRRQQQQQMQQKQRKHRPESQPQQQQPEHNQQQPPQDLEAVGRIGERSDLHLVDPPRHEPTVARGGGASQRAQSNEAHDGPAGVDRESCLLAGPDDDTGTKSATVPMGTGKRRRRYHHAEDIRIYGQEGGRALAYKRCVPMKPWPVYVKERRNTRDQDDADWDFEHGDSIPPNVFHVARLSQAFPIEELVEGGEDAAADTDTYTATYNGTAGPATTKSSLRNRNNILVEEAPARMKSLRSTDVTLREGDVPRGLLLRCWERAVHAASNSIFAPVTGVSRTGTDVPSGGIVIDGSDPSVQRSTGDHHHDDDESNNRSKAMQFDSIHTPLPERVVQDQCESFGIEIQMKKKQIACPRCRRAFTTWRKVRNHYYGHMDELGCCRPLLRGRHLQLIDDILQGHVQSQTDHLVDLILSNRNASASLSASSSGVSSSAANHGQQQCTTAASEGRLKDWNDILEILRDALDSSSAFSTAVASEPSRVAPPPSGHPVLETLQTAESSNNVYSDALVLNPMVVEAVGRRLVDRYATMPR